jgi:adenosine kinase
LTHSLPQTFAINLSAPFIPQFFGQQLSQVLFYCDFVFGNSEEATAWASAIGQENTTDIPAIARAITALPKANSSRPRVVVITQGAHPTILASSDDAGKVRTFEVNAVPKEEIVDTNAAGDAFAGGFLGAYVAGKDLDEAILVGHKLAAMCVKQASPSLIHLCSIPNSRNATTDRCAIRMAKSKDLISRLLQSLSEKCHICMRL